MWLIPISTFNKGSLLLPVFLFLFWLVKSVCRCCTKGEKTNNASQGQDPTGPLLLIYPLAGPCSPPPTPTPSLVTKRIPLIRICAKWHTIFNYVGMDWLNSGALWVLRFSSLSFSLSAKSPWMANKGSETLVNQHLAVCKRVLLGRWEPVKWVVEISVVYANTIFRMMSNLWWALWRDNFVSYHMIPWR